jgi:hypothetical protein
MERRQSEWRQSAGCSAASLRADSTPALPCAQVWHSFVHTFIDVLHAQGPAAPRLPAAAPLEPPPHVLPAVPRLIGIGDLHGDLKKARRAFKVAGLIDEQDRWTGGSTTVVQVMQHRPAGAETTGDPLVRHR